LPFVNNQKLDTQILIRIAEIFLDSTASLISGPTLLFVGLDINKFSMLSLPFDDWNFLIR